LLLAGAALFVRSLDRVLSQEAGFDRGVLVIATDAEAANYENERLTLFYAQLLDRLQAVPGVRSAALSMYPPISDEDGAWTQSVAVDGGALPTQPGQAQVYFNSISPAYFETIGMSLVAGRSVADSDGATGVKVAVVNETLVRRFLPGQNAVGRRLTIGRNANRQDLHIIGVVRDAKYQRLQEEPRSIAYVPWLQHDQENLFAEVRATGATAPLAEAIRREIRALDPIVPVRFQTVDDRIRESLVTERVMALLATGLGVSALALACAGLYGLLAYAVSKQTRDIGVRLALGAERGRVLRSILSESVILAALGTAAGLAGAIALGRFAANLLFDLSPRDPVSLAAAGALMLVVAVLAGFLPARRAARVDPVIALRAE
jgi:predicted permease